MVFLRRGVTRHSSTGKWEAHLWDGSFVRPKKSKTSGGRSRGRQVYLGGWSSEAAAGTAYDLGALWFWGASAQLNVPPPYLLPSLLDLGTCSNHVHCLAGLLTHPPSNSAKVAFV
jgi:hypothetical protein